jgi:hypothetical protein
LVEGSRQEPQGELRVAIPVFVGIHYASRVGATFLQRYPHSQLDIRLVDSMVDPVKDGFDVVFGTGPLQDSTLIARKVFSLELFLCASPDFVRKLAEPLTDPAQLNSLPFIDFGFCGPRKVTVAKQWRYELSPQVRAPTTFRCASSTSWKGWASEPCPLRSSAPTSCATAVSCRASGMETRAVGRHMIYPFELSFSTLISAFYEAACEIIVENSREAEHPSQRAGSPSTRCAMMLRWISEVPPEMVPAKVPM